MNLKNICVYCGSSIGRLPEYRAAAELTGRTLAERGIGVVYGGGNIGMMGAVADSALAANGKVIGVIPEALTRWEVAHPGVTEMFIVQTMHERKAMMADLSDAFLALPGGFGTLEELFEMLTWGQLTFHAKPCGILNVAGFFDPLLAYLDHSVTEGFLLPEHRALVLAHTDLDALLNDFGSFTPPSIDKWWDREIR